MPSGAPLTQTHTPAAASRRGIHTDIFIGGSAKAEHVMKIVGKAGAAIKQPAKKLTTAAAAARFVRLFRSPPCPFQPHLEERRKSGENNVCKNERMKEVGKAERQ